MNGIGFSGSSVRLVDHDRVEKAVRRLEDAPRLRAQCKMQRDFGGMLGKGAIRTPHVFGGQEVIYVDAEGRPTAGLMSFQMEYVEVGRPAFSVDSERIPTRLAEFVLELVQSSRLMQVDERIFTRKLEALWATLIEKGARDEVIDAVNLLITKWPASMPSPISHGLYHGDLTLCNVLVDGGVIHLIDFTPQIVPSCLFDMVKLRQDTAEHWFAMVDPTQSQWIEQMQDWDRIIDDAFKDLEEYKRYYFPFQALGLARILPYAINNPVLSLDIAKKVRACIQSF